MKVVFLYQWLIYVYINDFCLILFLFFLLYIFKIIRYESHLIYLMGNKMFTTLTISKNFLTPKLSLLHFVEYGGECCAVEWELTSKTTTGL